MTTFAVESFPLEKLDGFDRVLIAGGPRVGKSTLARKLAVRRNLTLPGIDDHNERGGYFLGAEESLAIVKGESSWSGGSQSMSDWMDKAGPWVIEGVAGWRAVRKRLATKGDLPVDVVVWMARPRLGLTPGQTAMHKGCETVRKQCFPALAKAEVPVFDDQGRRVL